LVEGDRTGVANGLVRELQEVRTAGTPADVNVSRDVRARRPPLFASILRLDTGRRMVRVVTLGALDAMGVFFAIFTALDVKLIVQSHSNVDVAWARAGELAPLAILVTLLLFARSGLYGDRSARPGFTRVVASLFQVGVILFVYALVEGIDFSSYYVFYGSLFFALFYVSSFRWAFDKVSGALLRAAGYHRRAVLVGRGEHIDAVAHALKDTEVKPVGFIALEPRKENGLKDMGPFEKLERHFDVVDEVLIADPDFPQDRAVELIDTCHRHGIKVRVAPTTMEILMDRVEFVPGQSLPLFELKPPVFEGIDFFVKRSFDIAGSALLILVLSPVLAATALAIRVTSRGRVIYRSSRPGMGGTPFTCFKFRTMYEDAEGRQDELEELNEQEGALFKIKDDPRVTPVGRFLRRWSIDELPQLFNVLRGEMSLVGPRPLPDRDYERLDDWHRKRYLVLPGVTGLWQVSGRSELDFDELVRLDFLYLERWSVFLDLSILLKTIPAVLRRRGAW
jgi:exopolysaccharide biosynthesis polyprenyl glycosylphosphotransferase